MIKVTSKSWSLMNLNMTHHDQGIASVFLFFQLQIIYLRYHNEFLRDH